MPPIRQIPRRTILVGLAVFPLATACGSNAQPTSGQGTAGSQGGPQLVIYKSPT